MGIVHLATSQPVLFAVLGLPWGPKRRRKGRSGHGYNTCSFCKARLPRDQEQQWRLSSICAKCGRLQPWATPNDQSSRPA